MRADVIKIGSRSLCIISERALDLKRLKLDDFFKGWLVGDFEPNLFRRSDIEVGVHFLESGYVDEPHFHMKSTEFNLVVQGRVKVGEEFFETNEIFVIEPGEHPEVSGQKNSIILVIRDASFPSDKTLVRET